VSVQGTNEWLMERLGHVTASRFADVLKQPRSKAAREDGDLSGSAEGYMRELMCELLTNKPARQIESEATRHGKRWENTAREAYMKHTGLKVEQVGFIKHPTERFVGCSPDGLTDDAGLEIKCPIDAQNHLSVLLDGVPKKHMAQIQGGMWVCGKTRWDFVSYHDDFHKDQRLLVIQVARDEQFIDTLFRAVLAFRDEMLSRMQSLIAQWKRKAA